MLKYLKKTIQQVSDSNT